MDISLTIFNNLYDNKTDKRVDLTDWDSFVRMLEKLAQIDRSGKKDAQLISPATYKPDTTRANDNVVEWSGWCAVDVDDHKFEGNLNAELIDRFRDWNFVCYSTASSTTDHPKFRLVFPLKGKIGSSRIRGFWHALQSDIGNIGDTQTKDLSRMYYIPGRYAGAYNFIFSHSGGKPIDPDVLMAKHPYVEKKGGNTFFDRLPEAMQKQIIEHRKAQAENSDIKWTSYRDCPLFPRTLEAEYRTISGTGWYHKMYQIMVAIAGNAVKQGYPITAEEIRELCMDLDRDTGNWYAKRPLGKEADRAIEYVYRNM